MVGFKGVYVAQTSERAVKAVSVKNHSKTDIAIGTAAGKWTYFQAARKVKDDKDNRISPRAFKSRKQPL